MPVLRVVVYQKDKIYSCVISLILPTGLSFAAASSGCWSILAAVTGVAQGATSVGSPSACLPPVHILDTGA